MVAGVNKNIIRSPKKIIFSSLIAVAAVLGFLWWNQPEAAAAWWNDAWLYRQAIPVTNNATAEINVYIEITLNTNTASTSMQADCGDFRFVNESGQILPYYIVSGCRTASNVIHVNFEEFPDGAQTIYFYYGNPSAENGFSEADFATEASNYTIGSVQAVEIGPGPIGYWSFDEGYGTTAHDGSGQGNDGAINGAVWQDESMCVAGKCLYFDGTDDYVDTGVSINTSENWSASGWAKININGGYQVWFGSHQGNRFYAGIENGHYFYGYGSAYKSSDTGGNQHDAIENNKWFHWALVGESGTAKYFIDGRQVDSLSYTGAGSQSLSNFIGARRSDYEPYDVPMNHADGFIDEVKIYPYARTADQIKQDYAAGLAGMGTPHGAAATFGGASEKWLTDGLVGYWKFDESATSSGAVDSSGNGNDGTYVGHASTTAGKFGRGGSFNRTDAYVSTPLSVANSESYTFSVWFNSAGFDSGMEGYHNIIASNVHPGYALYVRDSSNPILGFSTDFGHGNTATEADFSPINIGQWYHAVAINDAESGTISLYVDGELQDSLSRIGSIEGNLLIGSYVESYLWNGQLDEVRIYNRALSPDEVRKLYEWAPGPVGHWKMDEKVAGNAQTIYDVSGNENHGTTNWGANASGMDCAKKGKYGTACGFDGVDDYLQIGDPGTNSVLDFDTGEQLSLSFWMKASAPFDSKYITFINKSGSGNPSNYGVQLSNSGLARNVIFFYRNHEGTRWNEFHTDTAVAEAGEWAHYSVSYVFGQGSTVKIYKNGIEQSGSWVSGDGNDSPWVSNSNLTIGASHQQDGEIAENFNGLIDDVRIYNYARTQKQILEDMHADRPGPHPILHLNFDEGRGDTAYDQSGYGNHGTLNAGGSGGNATVSAMWDKGGRIGGAVEFDGSNDYTRVNSGYFTAYPFSMSAWVKIKALSADSALLSLQDKDVANKMYGIYVSSGGLPSIRAQNTTARDNSGHDRIDNGRWNHVAAIFNSATDRRLYVNGKAQNLGSITSVGMASADLDSFDIGRWGDSTPSNYFNGLIDEAKLFPYTLSIDEIKKEFASGGQAAVMGTLGGPQSAGSATSSQSAGLAYCVPGSTDPCAGPVGEWKFDEKGGTIAYDTSGNGNDGTLTNGPAWARGKFGSALKFNGTNSYLDIGAGPTTRTVSFWANPETTTQYFLNLASDTDYIWSNAGILTATGTIYVDGRLSDSIAARKWQHITVVLDADKNALNLDIGRTQDTNYMKGLVDQVRIYNYARTPAQIAWEYNRGAPVAHWAFNECQGSTIHDESGNGNHGTLNLGSSGVTAAGTCASSSDSFWYNGRNGKAGRGAGSFDGVDDHVSVPEISILEFSYSVWIYPKDIPQQWTTILTNTDMNRWFGIRDINNGIYEFYDGDSNHFSSEIEMDKWTNLILTYDGQYLKLFVNGVMDKTIFSKAYSRITDTFIIGDNTASETFDGYLDEVKIYNYPLTVEQAKMEYNSGAVRFGE
jgi:hypothetical protein